MTKIQSIVKIVTKFNHNQNFVMIEFQWPLEYLILLLHLVVIFI